MIQIILEDKYLIHDHMSGFMVKKVRESKEPVIIKKIKKSERTGIESVTDDYSNFESGSYYPNYPAVVKALRNLMISEETIKSQEELREIYEKTDKRIANIEKFFI